MLTLHFPKPMKGGKLTNDMPDSWSLGSFTCSPLAAGQAPPEEGLVANFAKGLVDGDGKPVPAETLRAYDLRGGLSQALQAAWA